MPFGKRLRGGRFPEARSADFADFRKGNRRPSEVLIHLRHLRTLLWGIRQPHSTIISPFMTSQWPGKVQR